MTQQEYIRQLEAQLQPLNPQERADILSDIAEHFDAGKADGKTEEQICQDLGLPAEYAAQFLPAGAFAKRTGSGAGVKAAKWTATVFLALIFVGFFAAFGAVALGGVFIFVTSLFLYPDFWTILGSFFYSVFMSGLGVAAFCGTFLLWQACPVYGKVSEKARGAYKKVSIHALISCGSGLAVLILVTFVAGAGGNSLVHNTDSVQQEVLTIEEGDSLELDSIANIEIYPAGDGQSRAEFTTRGTYFLFYPEYALTAERQGSTTRVTARAERLILSTIGYGRSSLRVYLPDAALESLEMRSASGDSILAGRDNIRRLAVTSTSGDVKLSDCTIPQLEVRNISGDVELQNVSGGSAKLSLTSGDIEMTGKFDDFTFQMASGDLEFRGEAGLVQGKCISGDATLDLSAAPEALDIAMTSGNVRMFVPRDAAFSVNYRATSGNFRSDLPYATVEQNNTKLYQFGGAAGSSPYKVSCVSGNFYINGK